MTHPSLVRRFSAFLVALLLIIASLGFSQNSAQAANFQQAYIRLDRMKASTVTTGVVCAKPATTSAVNVDLQIAFPTGFTVSTTGGNWATSTSNLPSGSSAWPGITAATATASSQTVTWTYSGNQTLTAGTLYCFNWTNSAALTTSTAGNSKTGTITTRTTAGATLDSSSYALAVITDDQIVVSATVPPIFTFSLSGNTDSFTANLSTTTVSTTGKTTTIATNGTTGWIEWVKSTNAGLTSATAGQTIATAGTVDDSPSDLASVTGYVLDVDVTTDSATGSGTVSQAAGYGAEYNGTNTTSGGALSTSFQPIAASSGTTDGDVLTLIERAKITAVQAAASDYTDTLTIVAAGRF